MMSPLPLDMPDDYPWLPSSARYPLADLGELAARLGSPVTYDRRGEVVWMDDMSHGLGVYRASVYGAGAVVRVTTDIGLSSGYALELVGGSDAERTAQLVRSFSRAKLGKTGLEIGFCMISLNEKFWTNLSRFDGSNQHVGGLRVYAETGQLTILKDDGTEQTIATLGHLDNPASIYHVFKLVCDFDSDCYVRLLFNDRVYDLSAYGLRIAAATDIPQYRMALGQISRAGYNDRASVGYIILTGNEP